MQNRSSLIDTLLFFEIFGFAPNFNDFHKFLIGENISKNELRKRIAKSKFIDSKNGYYFLKEAKSLYNQRIIRSAASGEKKALAELEITKLSKIPTIQSVALSGSVACDNARTEDDIDLFIITSPHCVWITRLMVYLLFKTTGKMRGKTYKNNLFCPNMFVSMDNLQIEEKNLYNASEIAHLVPLYDRNNSFGNFLNSNSWVQDFFPNFAIRKEKSWKSKKTNPFILRINKFLYIIQTIPMRKKITNEKISENRIQFHPNNLSFVILKLWTARKNAYYGSHHLHKLTHTDSIAEMHDLTPGS